MMRTLRNIAHWLGWYRMMDLLRSLDGGWDATTPLRPVSRVKVTFVVIVLLVVFLAGLWLLASIGPGSG